MRARKWTLYGVMRRTLEAVLPKRVYQALFIGELTGVEFICGEFNREYALDTAQAWRSAQPRIPARVVTEDLVTIDDYDFDMNRPEQAFIGYRETYQGAMFGPDWQISHALSPGAVVSPWGITLEFVEETIEIPNPNF